ncbi:phage integrase SAM-like domain-containing protein [Olivibacter ginsenosidimutans]|uniref:phage integrase SAM-like domain-containing protein n=1 Tax=Olivibacter ginsenosidimutans TaxID=1176537 RepID=UPI003CD087F6
MYARATVSNFPTTYQKIHSVSIRSQRYRTKQNRPPIYNRLRFYLRAQSVCGNNTTVRYIKNFKKIILICIANGWIQKDPFLTKGRDVIFPL